MITQQICDTETNDHLDDGDKFVELCTIMNSSEGRTTLKKLSLLLKEKTGKLKFICKTEMKLTFCHIDSWVDTFLHTGNIDCCKKWSFLLPALLPPSILQ